MDQIMNVILTIYNVETTTQMALDCGPDLESWP